MQNIKINRTKKAGIEDIRRVFTGPIAAGWDTKGKLLSQIKGNDNIVYEKISQYGHDNMKVLDIGCATGRLLSFVNAHFCDCLLEGIDISEDMLFYAKQSGSSNGNRKKIVNDEFLVHDFGNEKFDLIVLKFVLHHMVDEDMVLTKAKNLLLPNGKIFLYTPGKEHFKEIFEDFNEETDILGRKSEEQLKQFLEKCGMHNYSITPCHFSMQMHTFEEFIDFLKRIGSYQKVVGYQDISWDNSFMQSVRNKFKMDMWHTGEFLLVIIQADTI